MSKMKIKRENLRRVLFLQNFTNSSTPMYAPKGNYGTVNLLPVVNLLENVSRHLQPVINDVPLSFEDMDINQGFVLYETNLPKIEGSTKLPLTIDILHDRATIFLNKVRVHVLIFHSRRM